MPEIIIIGLSVALLISVITSFSLMSQLETARSCIDGLIEFMKKAADEMDLIAIEQYRKEFELKMKDKAFIEEIDLYSQGEPEHEIPDESILYDWDGEVLHEVE
ncbi:MAG: hypothetical protein PUF75_04900 [Coprococcus sp.]|mgnify:FL=1|jgi:hypothetical protein|nr:hypothetical protein [Coprococcus sp.]